MSPELVAPRKQHDTCRLAAFKSISAYLERTGHGYCELQYIDRNGSPNLLIFLHYALLNYFATYYEATLSILTDTPSNC